MKDFEYGTSPVVLESICQGKAILVTPDSKKRPRNKKTVGFTKTYLTWTYLPNNVLETNDSLKRGVQKQNPDIIRQSNKV